LIVCSTIWTGLREYSTRIALAISYRVVAIDGGRFV
jgi:hypothetical protein